MTPSALRWPLLALLGLLVAAAIAILATRAVSADIGISSEPPSVGRSLAPAPPSRRPKPAKPTVTVTVPSPSPSPGQPPVGDGSGETGDD